MIVFGKLGIIADGGIDNRIFTPFFQRAGGNGLCDGADVVLCFGVVLFFDQVVNGTQMVTEIMALFSGLVGQSERTSNLLF